MTEDGKFVLPGEAIGFSEEFMPGDWTFEEEGNIIASVTGNVKFDMKERKINVIPLVSVPPEVKNGDAVIGQIWELKPQLALVDVIKIKGVERTLPGQIRGAIHISKTREGYVSELSKEFAVGDVVLAKVQSTDREPLELTTISKEMGVIKAFCLRCGGPMEPFKHGLRCLECKHIEPRKVSSEYGKGEV